MSENAQEPTKRLTVSEVARKLLERDVAPTETATADAVTLSGTRDGQTLIEVTKRATDGDLQKAAAEAKAVYDALRAEYPAGDEGTGERGSVTLARNAKGEVQPEVTMHGDAAQVAGLAQVTFDRLIAAYPLSTGFVLARASETPSKPVRA